MARSQPIVYTLSPSFLTQSITQSLLHTPFPHPYLLVHLLYSNSLTRFSLHFFFRHAFLGLLSFLSTAVQPPPTPSKQTLHAQFNKVNYDNNHIV